MVYSIWDENNICLSWKDTEDICDSLGLITVPVINIGFFTEKYLVDLSKSIDTSKVEGYVIRNSNQFRFEDFSENIGKFVRTNHVTSNSHWMYDKIVSNKLK